MPPTRIGSRPRAVISRIAADASRAYRAAEYSSVRIRDVDQVVRNALRARPSGTLSVPMSKPAIDGGRVAADHFAVEALRQRDAERALAGRGRTDNRDEPRARHHRPRKRAHERERDERGKHQQQTDLLRPRRLDHRSGVFVEVEGDREERAVVGILGRQRLRGIRGGQRVERRVVERADVRRPQTPSAR